MSNPKAPTRAELSRIFNGDQRVIRAFEELFKIIPSELEQIDNEAGNSDAKGIQAIALSIDSLRIAKSANVLLWLSM